MVAGGGGSNGSDFPLEPLFALSAEVPDNANQQGPAVIARFLAVLLLVAALPRAQATQISQVVVSPATVACHARLEVTFQLSTSHANPFDPEEVDARGIITQPDGSEVTVPAFYFMQYDLAGSNPERLLNGRNPSWKVRFAARQVGTHSIALAVTDAQGTAIVDPAGSFVAVDEGRRSIVRVDPRDARFLAHEDGTPYHPIGRNISWATNAGTKDYERWMSAMAETGQNFGRVWMTHFFRGQSIEWSSSHHTGYYQGLGRYSLPIAVRLDRIVELAEEHGILLMIALHHHGQFSTSVNPNWADNPYNIARAADGGFLNTPQEFFTHPQARELTKRRLRYIIARWGYSSSVLCWELFNEVQFTNGFRESAPQRAHVAAWHEEMGGWIRANDPFNHLVSTSSDHAGFEAIWPIPSMELMQEHEYSADKIRRYEVIHDRLSQYGKPVLFAEFGAPGSSTPEQNIGTLGAPFAQQMIDGLVLHNGIWSSAMLGSAAMYWWWEYIEQYGHDAQFAPLAAFLAGETLAGKELQTANPVVLQQGTPRLVTAVPGITGFFSPSPQTTFVIDEDGLFPGIDQLSQWLHGTFQNALRSDPSFTMTFATPGTLRIHVTSVSNAGNNSVQVRVDGQAVLSQPVANGSTNFVLDAPIGAGTRTIQVLNTGQDWLRIGSYEFDAPQANIARAMALQGPRHAYAWIHDMGSDYGKAANGALGGMAVQVNGLDEGLYHYEFHRTWPPAGMITSGEIESVGGLATVAIPEFEKDIALKLRPADLTPAGDFDMMGIY